MKAQDIYDLREVTGFVSGTDLHDFFRQTVGEPSPSGAREITAEVILAHPLGTEIMELLEAPTRENLADIRQYVEMP